MAAGTVLTGDLGGTKCRVGIVDADGAVHAAQRLPTLKERGPFLAGLCAAFRAALDQAPKGSPAPSAIGIGTAGVIAPGGRVIVSAPNLPLDGMDLAAHLEGELGLPTTLLNDGRASAWGEQRMGSAKGLDPLLCLFFGTGIGIGVIAGGRPHEGADNAAGEIGHTIYRPSGRRCPCGGLGHFEAYCGGRALVERAVEALGPAPAGLPVWTPQAIMSHGDPAGLAVLEDAAVAACCVTANACTLWNPRAVVLGGGVIEAWPDLMTRIETFVRAECSASITGKLQFHRSQGGSDAILVGAAAAAGLFRARK